jgi:hypothetical protein
MVYVIKRFESFDGKRRVSILARDDGFYAYEEMAEDFEDMRCIGGAIERTWLPVQESGIYESAEDAERDARLAISWMREKLN